MEKSPIQIDDLNPLSKENLEKITKILGVEQVFLYVQTKSDQWYATKGMCTHEIIGACVDIIDKANEQNAKEEHDHEN